MKNKIFKSLITAGIILLSLPSNAQQAAPAKAPEVSGPVLPSTQENKTSVVPATDDKNLPETATKKSSITDEAKPVKGKDDVQPAKAPEQKPLPETNKLTPPPSSYPVKKDN